MQKIKKDEWKKYLMVDDYMLDKVITDIEKFDHTKILICTDNKMPDVTLKNVVMDGHEEQM